MTKLLPIAVLISGGGTTLKNLIDCRDRGELPVDFKLVVSSRSEVKGLEYARQAGIPNVVLPRKRFASDHAHSQAIFTACQAHQAPWVVMGGFLCHVVIPEEFRFRVINIHPSLIPSFSGKGYYGLHVHQAAVDYGVKVSGCTVHFVDDDYDHGPVILQRTCPVFDDDTAESLQRRVFEVECKALPEAIRIIAQDRLQVEPNSRRIKILDRSTT
jgi:phosphoribosylglycinamide formyltransferase 1